MQVFEVALIFANVSPCAIAWRDQFACIEATVPSWFLPVRSDVECASTIVNAVEGEISSGEIKRRDSAHGHYAGSLWNFTHSACFRYDQRFNNQLPLWNSQFGNQFFFWMELAAEKALCENWTQDESKIFNVNYCRDEIHGGGVQCSEFLRLHPPEEARCSWSARGAYAPAAAIIREEWERAAFLILRNQTDLHQWPCPHVPNLPLGADYAAIYVRCGDYATTNKMFLNTSLLRRVVPAMLEGNVSHILIFGNRGVHINLKSRRPVVVSAKDGERQCITYFDHLKTVIQNLTHKTVLVVPEQYAGKNKNLAQVTLVRDLRCMTQSHVLVDFSLGSSFGYVATFLHNGCATFLPFHSANIDGSIAASQMHSIGTRQRFFQLRKGDFLPFIDLMAQQHKQGTLVSNSTGTE